MKRDKKIVPSLMFHSAGLEDHPWEWSYISESVASFEEKIALLKKRGFYGVSWDELYWHMAGEVELADNAIFLTFDDGYLDNWVYVYPILKKYGMKGTVFVSPDFVDPADELRPTIEDVAAGNCRADELQVAGFLSWAEMREMEASGLIDIQSHAMTHTWYFSGPRIETYHRPYEVTPYPWLFWNARPDRKPYYLAEDQQGFLPWGYPILEHQKSLAVTQFFPDENAVNRITDYVAGKGGAAFFERHDWQELLHGYVTSLFPDGQLPGRYESPPQRADRVRAELEQSRRLIGEHLNKDVNFICWPGGANDPLVQDLARSVGYKSWTLSSSSQLEKRNRPGADPESIKRIGTTNILDVRGRNCGVAEPRFQLWNVLAHQESAWYKLLVKARKLAALATTTLVGR